MCLCIWVLVRWPILASLGGSLGTRVVAPALLAKVFLLATVSQTQNRVSKISTSVIGLAAVMRFPWSTDPICTTASKERLGAVLLRTWTLIGAVPVSFWTTFASLPTAS